MIKILHRTLIQVELRKRAEAWGTTEFMTQAFGALIHNSNYPPFFIEREQNGYYYISENLVAYCNLNDGTVFRIRKDWASKDYQCYAELGEKAKELGTFRVDVPSYREEFGVKDSIWEYAELQSPGQQYGLNYNDDVFSWPELTNGITPNASITEEQKTSVKNYFKEFVDQSKIITHQARLIAEKNNCGIPFDLCYIWTRYKDSQGYFWSDFDQRSWNQSKNEVIVDSLTKLQSAMGFAMVCGMLDEAKAIEVYNYAREQWALI